MLAPEHVQRFCTEDITEVEFAKLHSEYADANCAVYQIKCCCSNEQFHIIYDERPSCWAKCTDCGNVITLYDLKCYPSAIYINNIFTKYNLSEAGSNVYKVCVMYEYADDYESCDDISWCNIWCKNKSTGNILNLINDETS